jgi:chemotaxis protein CheC
VHTTFSELQLDALRELANVGSGNAATALASLVGRSVDITVPDALVLPLPETIETVGDMDEPVTAVVLPVDGDLDAVVLLVFSPEDEETLCRLLGVEARTELGVSALAEIGNILGSSYVNALGGLTGISLEPRPPAASSGKLGAIFAGVLSDHAARTELALLLDSDLVVENEACSFAFVLIPTADGVGRLLRGLGVA